MQRFALIGHYLSWDLLYKNSPEYNKLPQEKVLKILEERKPRKVTDLKGVVSEYSGKKIEGIGISIDLLPEQILSLDKKLVLGKIIDAGYLAQKHGAEILVLGAYTSIVGQQGLEVSKVLPLPVTTGNSYTAASVIETVKIATYLTDINLRNVRLLVIGATGSIGSICCSILAEMVQEVMMVARNQKKLKTLENIIASKKKAKITVIVDIKKALSLADVVIIATSTPYAFLTTNDFKPGTLVLDVSVPHNIAKDPANPRNDILILEGGLIKPPGNLQKSDFDIGLPPGIAPACLCEGMILCFENRAESYTLGLKIKEEKVKEIYELGKKHGFRLAGFGIFGKNLTLDTLCKNSEKIIKNQK